MKRITLIIFSLLFVVGCNKKKTEEVTPTSEEKSIEKVAPTWINCRYDLAYNFVLEWKSVESAVSYNVYGTTSVESFVLITNVKTNSYTSSAEEASGYSYFKIEAVFSDDTKLMSEIAYINERFTEPVDDFKELSSTTGGTTYGCSSSDQLDEVLTTVVRNHCTEGTDLVFLVDNTGSMGDDIEAVKANLSALIGILPADTRVGAAYYRDNNVDTDWYGNTALTTDFASVNTYIHNFYADGGGDWEESVYDGIYNTVSQMNWRPRARKIVIVIGDAPPLVGSFSQHSVSDIVALCASSEVAVNLYPVITSYDYSGMLRTTSGASAKMNKREN